jgi:hypothetical protein
MAKAAIGLFEDSGSADKAVAHLLKSGFPRDEVRLVRAVDFDGGSESEILKMAALLKDEAGRYWEVVRHGRVLVAVTTSDDKADQAVIIMDEEGTIGMEGRKDRPVESLRAAPSDDTGLYSRTTAAQLFEVS